MSETLTSQELNELKNLITEVFDYTQNSRTFKAAKGNTFTKPLVSMFGFVPVIENNKINLYIKIGGPEIVRFGNVIDSSGTFSKIPKVLDAVDRDNLTHALATEPKKYGYTKREVKNDFPLRIIYQGGYRLQYAKDADSEYLALATNSELKASIVSEVITTAIEYFGLLASVPEKADIQLLLKASKIEQGVGEVFTLFMDKLKEDLEKYIGRILSHNYDSSSSFFGVSSHEHHLADKLLEGFLSYPIKGDLNRSVEKFADFKSQLDSSISGLLNSITLASQSNQEVTEYVKNYTDLLGMSTKADLNTIASLNGEITGLKTENKVLKSQLEEMEARLPSNPNLPKYLGIGAGLVSGYLAIQQESAQGLENWQKGAIVATSGLLGAVPYLNFVTIATMPYLVNKGVQLSGDDEFKASARARMAQARQGAGRLATSVGQGASRLASSAKQGARRLTEQS